MENNLKILSRAIDRWTAKDRPVSRAPTAQELTAIYDLSLGEQACSRGELESAIDHFLDYSPNTAQPEFYKLLYSGLNQEALLGDWITSLCNSTMHTYQVSPVATLMELELIRQWNKLVGFDDGDGVMVSGGSQANLVAMMLARHRACPELKSRGFYGVENPQPLVAYVSDQAHYSYQRAVNVLGIGTENLISIASDEAGRICPAELAEAIAGDVTEGRRPFFIGLTAGTTVVGAFDPVTDCSEIARKHNVWLHIDGAWGAPVLFSETHKNLIGDCQLADSFAWDAHKLMNVPITAAVILTKQSHLLRECCAGGGGEYLFHEDANSDYNLGERSLQCGRRVDALKVWLSWKALGNTGFAGKIDRLQKLKARGVEMIEQSASLDLLAPAAYLNILFRYTPNSSDDEQAISRLNIKICELMKLKGGPYIDYAHYKGRTGIRLILANKATTQADLARLFAECELIGAELENDPEWALSARVDD